MIVEDDIATTQNTMMSPKHFQEFIMPYNQQVIDRAKARGMKVIEVVVSGFFDTIGLYDDWRKVFFKSAAGLAGRWKLVLQFPW